MKKNMTTTRKFAELRAKMSPESRKRAAAKAEAMSRGADLSDDMPLPIPRDHDGQLAQKS